MKKCPECMRVYADAFEICEVDGLQLISAVVPAQDPSSKLVINNRYRIQKKLCDGNMSVIYLAERSDTKLPAVVKLLYREYSANSERVALFRQEAQRVATVRHPNVMQLYECDEADEGNLFIAMEYVIGRTLREYRRASELETSTAVALAIQIARGVSAVHEAGVLHRDLMPGNVMVVNRDSEVRVMNFGIARLRETLSPPGAVSTPAYAAPEQIKGLEFDERTDIYAFGVMLYEMLTSTLPFRASTPDEMLAKHLNEQPPSMKKLRSAIPDSIENIVLRALAKKPEDRWPTLKEMADALCEVKALLGEIPAKPHRPATPRPTSIRPTPQVADYPKTEFLDSPTPAPAPRENKPAPPLDPNETSYENATNPWPLDSSESAANQPTLIETTERTLLLETVRTEKPFLKRFGFIAAGLVLAIGAIWYGLSSHGQSPARPPQPPLPSIKTNPAPAKGMPPSSISIDGIKSEPPGSAETLPMTITIQARKREIVVNERTSLRALGKYADGRTKDLRNDEVRWESGNPNVAAINSRAEITGKNPGSTQVLARLNSVVSDSFTVIVKPAPPRNQQLAKPSIPSKTTDVSERIKKARAFLDQGAYAEALNELNNAAKADPLNREVQNDINTTKQACNAEKKLGRSELTCQ